MKLSEKIKTLRKKYNYSQDELAELCNVSRQAISKWESSQSIPELDKLIIMSNLFYVSIDTLIKEDLSIDSTIENHSCHQMIKTNEDGYYEGLLIKESISDEKVLDLLSIHKIELWKTDGNPKYWTALYFTSQDINLPEKMSEVMLSGESGNGNWYVDFKHNNTKYIVFKDKILSYTIGNKKEKEKVSRECKKLGIQSIEDIDE